MVRAFGPPQPATSDAIRMDESSAAQAKRGLPVSYRLDFGKGRGDVPGSFLSQRPLTPHRFVALRGP